MIDVTEEVAEHAWAWTEVVAWWAGTLGTLCIALAERLFDLEEALSPPH